MRLVVYSADDRISGASFAALDAIDSERSIRSYRHDGSLVAAEGVAEIEEADLVIFLSKHKSASGSLSFTTHALGNWGDRADVGGAPKSLSCAAPVEMLALLQRLHGNNSVGFDVTYEATHHGPLVNKPVLFAEFGGPDPDSIELDKPAEILARSVYEMLNEAEPEFDKIAFGVGSPHYPSRFTKLAIEGRYAFSHIMPNYAVSNVDMVPMAIERSKPEPEIATVEWKSIKSAEREAVIKSLEEAGLDYVRV
ncbi:MAG: D-aminoacyl-tRNA deacylase [Candidatus Micrarchaeota archaeon]|nr:D-aminoacyl-tRNA deacylase [Candidatus Micrarchaeota archaeon]